MRRVAEVSSFNLMYNLCLYYEKQKSYDKTELTFQPTLVQINYNNLDCPNTEYKPSLNKNNPIKFQHRFML